MLRCLPYERLAATYFSGGMDQNINYAKFVEAMAPILQTSAYMLEQVISGSIKISQSDGKIVLNCLEL